jgi:membrane protease YdiL (CAAX protease family)
MPRPVPPALSFVAALAPMVASQLVRLAQSDPVWWVALDYAGRLGALAVLAFIPSARAIAFRTTPLAVSWHEVVLWILGVVLADWFLGDEIRLMVEASLPGTRLGVYPDTTGWLHRIDIVLGLAAASEEILFRRCARHVFQTCLGDGAMMVIASSLLFGAYHWWTGIGNVVATALLGVVLMLFYRRSQALWPVVLGHYLTDIVYFA